MEVPYLTLGYQTEARSASPKVVGLRGSCVCAEENVEFSSRQGVSFIDVFPLHGEFLLVLQLNSIHCVFVAC